MRLLRGKWFIAACVLAVLVGNEIGGSGLMGWLVGPEWFSRASVRAWRAATDPPGPVRLTRDELEERDARLKAAFGEAVPNALPFWVAGRDNGLVVRDFVACRLTLGQGSPLPDKACEIVKLRGDFRVMLQESHAKSETVFIGGTGLFGPIFFFLGKDGKGKILLWAPARFDAKLKLVRVGTLGISTALTLVGGYENLMFGDDPGPAPDNQPDWPLSLSGVYEDGRSEHDKMRPDPDLARRFQYYAALMGRPYDPKEWISPKAEGQRAIKRQVGVAVTL
jgi:hypothetical protein